MRKRVDLKSPVRENRPPGSVRGAPGNRCPYLDSNNRNTCTAATSRLRLATAGRPPRAGKITRLPVEIREELNERLFEGELGTEVLAWLTGLPEARSVLDTRFEFRSGWSKQVQAGPW
jgi:hypothetical protein